MGKEKELAEIIGRVEDEISGLDTLSLGDVVEEIAVFLDKWDPDGDSDDPVLEALATLGASLEDLSADIEYVSDALCAAEELLE